MAASRTRSPSQKRTVPIMWCTWPCRLADKARNDQCTPCSSYDAVLREWVSASDNQGPICSVCKRGPSRFSHMERKKGRRNGTPRPAWTWSSPPSLLLVFCACQPRPPARTTWSQWEALKAANDNTGTNNKPHQHNDQDVSNGPMGMGLGPPPGRLLCVFSGCEGYAPGRECSWFGRRDA